MIRRFFTAMLSVVAVIGAGGITACSPHAQKEVKEGVQAVGADVKDTAHEVATDPQLKRAGADLKDAAKSVGSDLKDAAHDVTHATKEAASDAKADVHEATAPTDEEKK